MGDRARRGVSQAQVKARDCAAGREGRGLAGQFDRGRLATLAHDFNIAPADVTIPSSAERLHRGLLRGKARRVTLEASAAARFAIGNFALSKDSRAKTFSGERAN